MIEQPRWRRYMRLWGADVRADVDDELRFHIDKLAAEYRAAGAPPAEAERRARKRFGNYATYEAACIEIGEETAMKVRRRDLMDTLWQDLRFAGRQLRVNGLVTLAALLTIALGIGANTAIFSVVNAVLLRPLPYHESDRIMAMFMSFPEYRDVQDRQHAFEDVTVWASNVYSILGDAPEEVLGGVVQPNFFSMLMQPALGHGIDAEEANSPVVVISDALWRRRFQASSSVLGQTLTLAGQPYTIIGVMPRSFQYPNASFDVWVPFDFAMSSTPAQRENRSLRIFRVLARLAADATVAQASAELRSLSEEWQTTYPQTNAGLVFDVTPLSEQLIGDIRPRLTLLLAAVGFVMLIACVNVANLMLGQVARRGREMAVRRSLGAPRSRLLRQLLTESALLALLGGLGGVALAALSLRLLPTLAVNVPRLNEVAIDRTVLLYALGASILTALLFGIIPALHGSRADLRDALQEGGRSGIGSRRGGRLRAALVATEVAVSIVVLVGAGLLVHSLARVLDQDIGIRTDSLVHANVGLFYFDEPTERIARLELALERVSGLERVIAAAASSGLPPQSAQRATGFSVVGRTADAAEQEGAYWVGVTVGYFSTVGAHVIRGREVAARDRIGSMPVAVINESFARRIFGGADPIGRQVRPIVGVVSDIRYQGVEQPPEPTIYTPFYQTPFMWAFVMVRTPLPAQQFAPGLRAAVGGVDARMTPSRVVQQSDIVSSLLAQRRFVTLLLGSFAALALVLAAVGIYGVTATAVTERRREIGIRLALGADPRTVLQQVIARALLPVSCGLAAGMLAALWLTRMLTAMLYEVETRDPATFLTGATLMIAVAVIASALPARRAARVDPLVSLREQ
jgi:predicted permease